MELRQEEITVTEEYDGIATTAATGDNFPTQRSMADPSSRTSDSNGNGLLDVQQCGSGAVDISTQSLQPRAYTEEGQTNIISGITYSPQSLAAQYLISLIHRTADRFWHEPDHQALDVVLSFLGGYFLHERNPFWLHIVGESSSGKTELGLAPVSLAIQEFHTLDDLTPNTLLSGLTKGKDGGKRNSLLHRIGMFGLIYMGDFTTLLEKDERLVSAIAGQIRRVYDGELTKEGGIERRTKSDGSNGTKDGGKDDSGNTWRGRISWITAMTPSAERKWIKHNPMGERFSIVRWRGSKDQGSVLRKVLAQVEDESTRKFLDENGQPQPQQPGPRNWISWLTQRLAQGVKSEVPIPPGVDPTQLFRQIECLGDIELDRKPAAPSEEFVFGGGVYAMSEVVTRLRSVPPRPDGRNIGQRNLDLESGGRFQHQLIKVARGFAHLNRREVEAADLQLVKRVAEDSIPLSKKPIVKALVEAARSDRPISNNELMEEANYGTLSALAWQLQDLEALNVVETLQDDVKRKWEDGSTEWYLDSRFADLWEKGFGKR